MSMLDVLLGRVPEMDQAELNLGKPDEEEAKNLRYHVSRCALRWILSFNMSRANNVQIAQLRLLLIIAIVVNIAVSAPALKIWLAIAKAFGLPL